MGETKDDDYMQQLEKQRKAFEAQFGSLESMGFEDKVKEGVENSDSSESDHDESDNETHSSSSEESEEEEDDAEEEETDHPVPVYKEKSTTKGPRVIKFSAPSDTYIEPSKQEQKMIRSGKTLRQLSVAEQRKQLLEEQNKKSSKTKADDEDEAENLENDIELQRFLKESHLLSVFNQQGGDGTNDVTSGVDLTLKSMNDTNVVYQDDQVSGKSRMRTLEMRLGQLSETNGHNNKINKLEKVPMQIRRGMIKKHVGRIKQYEQDAADGGIILSKVKKGQFRKIEATYKKDIERRIGQSIKSQDKERQTKRQRGLKIQSVGRSTRNGLIISKDDISRIGGTVGNHKRKWNANKPHKSRR